jgi:hypothetical protein
MTEHTTETIKYAIRLPNGELVQDLPDPVFGKPQYRTFPDESTRAVLWDDHDDAVRTIDAIARKNTLWGMSELFVQYSDVVRVRISFEILDHEPVVEAEVEGLTIPRTWQTAAETPWDGVVFRPSDPEYADNPIRWARSGGCDYFTETYPGETARIVTADDINARFTGFVEVLS